MNTKVSKFAVRNGYHHGIFYQATADLCLSFVPAFLAVSKQIMLEQH
jgi:hypothetical protein